MLNEFLMPNSDLETCYVGMCVLLYLCVAVDQCKRSCVRMWCSQFEDNPMLLELEINCAEILSPEPFSVALENEVKRGIITPYFQPLVDPFEESEMDGGDFQRPIGVYIAFHYRLALVKFPFLFRLVHGSFVVTNNGALTTLLFPLLRAIDCDFDITQNRLSGAVPPLPRTNVDGPSCRRLGSFENLCAIYDYCCEHRKRAVYTLTRQCHVQTDSDGNCFSSLANCNFTRDAQDAPGSVYTDNGCDCVAKSYVCGTAVAGPRGEPGARGNTRRRRSFVSLKKTLTHTTGGIGGQGPAGPGLVSLEGIVCTKSYVCRVCLNYRPINFRI